MKEPESRLIIIAPAEKKRQILLNKSIITIGRSEQSDVVVQDVCASRNHACLSFIDGSYSLVDLDSRNGTYVNKVKLQSNFPKILSNGDEIEIGSFSIIFCINGNNTESSYDDCPLNNDVVYLQSASNLLQIPVLSGSNENIKQANDIQISNHQIPIVITNELKSDVEILAKHSRALGFMYELSKMLNRVFTIEEVYEKVSDYIFRISNCGRVVFVGVKKNELKINWVKYRDDNTKAQYDGISISRTIVRKVINEKVSLLSVDPMNDPFLKDKGTFRFGKIRSVMCASLVTPDNEVLGSIYVDKPEAIGFTNDDLDFLTAVAANGALALENIEAHEKALRDASARLIYQRFMPSHVVDRILNHPESIEIGGTNQVATILFADIRNFTLLSEQITPQEIVVILNNFFERASSVIFGYGGTLDKFIGDGIMAIFGAPSPGEMDSLNAIRTAIAIQREVQLMNKELQDKGNSFSINIGVGINTGEVTVGYIGSRLRTDYTAIGDPVNLASRLEANAKAGQILIGEKTYSELRSYINKSCSDSVDLDFDICPAGGLRVKGKTKSVQVYQVVVGHSENDITLKSGVRFQSEELEFKGLKRKEVRANLRIKVRVLGKNVNGKYFEVTCLTENISYSGVCMHLDHEVSIGEKLMLKGLDSVFSAQVEVCSVALVKNYYRTGVRFTAGSYPILEIK